MIVSAMGRPSWERSCTSKHNEKPSFPQYQHGSHLDIIALVIITTFAEKAVGNDFVDVELVENWVGVLQKYQQKPSGRGEISYLAETCGENDHLVNLPHLFQKVVDARSFENVEVVPVVFNLDRNNEICLLDSLIIHSVSRATWVMRGEKPTLKLL
jgi:hypothetical protein